MRTRFAAIFALVVCFSSFLSAQVTGPVVRFQTRAGDMDVMLFPDIAPITVANFLKYVNRGSYDNTFIHRSVKGFIVQGGGYQWVNRQPVAIPPDGAIQNEYKTSNTRGTIAMAKLDGDPNSATSEWFFNLTNNAGNLDNQNGGFTVFGRITNAAGLLTMDRIANAPLYNQFGFDSLPLANYFGGEIQDTHMILIRSITQVSPPVSGPVPSIESGGVITASGFGGFTAAARGSYVQIKGTNLGEVTREWLGGDFVNGSAPTSLDDVSVTVGGEAAFISYISPGQINAQVPAAAPTGDAVPVVVRYKGQASAAFNMPIKPIVAGMLAPPTFNVGGKQYIVAVRADRSYVSNGSIPNIGAAPAVPGEQIQLYGIGFGPVTPTSLPYAGKIAESAAPLAAPIEIKIGTIPAQVEYAGLAPSAVGLYQFNVIVPVGAPSGDLPVSITVAGETIPQTLFLSVR